MTNWAMLGGGISKVTKIYEGGMASTTANTKGSWVDLSASGEDYNIFGLTLMTYSMSYEGEEYLVDVGLGSTPDIIINNLSISRKAIRVGIGYNLPIYIPKNTEIQARQQSTYAGTQQLSTCAYAWQGARWGSPKAFTKVLTYGANTSDSGGTLVDPGGTANTFGSYVQFASGGLPHAIQGFMLTFGSRDDWARASTHWYVDVAKNYGSEETLIDQWIVGACDEFDAPVTAQSPFFPIRVEEGEDFSIRTKCSLATSDRYIDIVLYCFA